MKEEMEATKGQCSLAYLHGLPACFFFPPPHQPPTRAFGGARSVVGLPDWGLKGLHNDAHVCLQTNLMEAVSQLRFPLPTQTWSV